MILVTGATGFIGGHLVAALRAARQPFRCLVRPKRGRVTPAGDVVEGDLTTGAGLADALRDIDTVIHLAGVTKALSPDDYYVGNARATETLARAVGGRPIRFVHVSSLAAIGPSNGVTPVQEDDPPHPLTNYGRSKLEAERVVRSILPGAVIVRPPVVYGPGDTDVFQLLKSISKGLVVEIAGGERWFSAIYVEDLARGLLMAAGSTAGIGRSYFFTHAQRVSWTELADAASALMQRKARTLRVPVGLAHGVGFCAEMWSRLTRKPGIVSREKVLEARCAAWLCDHRRAAAELGFTATTPLSEGLAKTLAWYKEAGWLSY